MVSLAKTPSELETLLMEFQISRLFNILIGFLIFTGSSTIASKVAPDESVKVEDLPVLKDTISIQNKSKEEQMDINKLKGLAGKLKN